MLILSAKLTDRCHSCSITTGYNRCHIIEHVVDSTKVSCFYGDLGCTEKITYYKKTMRKCALMGCASALKLTAPSADQL